MANRKVSIWKYVKVGSRWKYCKPVYGRNNKIKPHWALVNGKPGQHPEGNFYISYRQGKKKIWKKIGPSPSEADYAAYVERSILNAKALGVPIKEETVPLEYGPQMWKFPCRLQTQSECRVPRADVADAGRVPCVRQESKPEGHHPSRHAQVQTMACDPRPLTAYSWEQDAACEPIPTTRTRPRSGERTSNRQGCQIYRGRAEIYPDDELEARCRVAPAARHVSVVDRPAEVPDPNCTCGLYAAKNLEHLRQLGYASYGICGEVYLWGIVVEHRLGWRAQFAYPKNLILPLSLLPFTLAELNARLFALTAFGVDIFVLHNRESMRLWKHGQGYDATGLDYIISLRGEHYLRQQQERTLKEGDRVALLGRGIAVVQRVDDEAAVVALGNGFSLKIARKDIVMSQRNLRWECRISS